MVDGMVGMVESRTLWRYISNGKETFAVVRRYRFFTSYSMPRIICDGTDGLVSEM